MVLQEYVHKVCFDQNHGQLPMGDKLQPDDAVQIHSINTKPELNGKIARVISFQPDSGRWEIQLADEMRLRVKASNLSKISGEIVWR